MTFIRIILFPVSILYGFITYVRNKLFDWKILHSVSFNLPVVSVGNLSVGGTGKTPHVEYIIQLLKKDYKIATLSRGYKRKSKGFILADQNESSESLGDEPFQFKVKFNDIEVAVDTKRVHGVEKLLEQVEDLEMVLLDDAFQHRWISPGLSILLTDFYHLYRNDYLLPTGNLRECRSGAKRADIIIVTKTPEKLSSDLRKKTADLIKPESHQSLYFSSIRHGKFSPIPGVDYSPEKTGNYASILLVAGIANPYPLELYLADRCTSLDKIYFSDHHRFTVKDIERIKHVFEKIPSKNKMIVTTEKDMMRFMHPEIQILIKHLPICYVPIRIAIHEEDQEGFENQIYNYVKNSRRNRTVH